MILKYTVNDEQILIEMNGSFINFNEINIKNNILCECENNSNIKNIIFNYNVDNWDSSFVVFLYKLKKISIKKNIVFNDTNLPNNIINLLKLAFSVDRKPFGVINKKLTFFEKIGEKAISIFNSFNNGLFFLSDVVKSLKRFFVKKAVMRKVDILYALEECTYKAIPIVSLINFMVGLILAFVGAIQLQTFGAQIFIASLVSIGMVRIMGAIMTGIIIAGRTGASYAATIGTMQVNDEVDALKTMGISTIDFLLLPRILALIVSMPILTLFANILGILGGAFVGVVILKLPAGEYMKMTFNILNLNHFLIGLFHSFIFGIVIAICGCYYGINCGKDADSVGKSTTNAVVSSIIWIIIMTGIITLVCQIFGI